MKITVINGSPRKGNSLCAINTFVDAAKGHEFDIINADGLNISPCRGCGACGCTAGCVADDDSNAIVDRIIAADMIVFVTPVYWWGMTAQLKTVVDKCYCKGVYMKGKAIGTIVVGGADTSDPEYRLIREQFECIAKYLNLDYRFALDFFESGLDDLANDEAAIAVIRETAASLA